MAKAGITEVEVKNNLKGVSDEFYEELKSKIDEELINIIQIKKQISKIQKKSKLPDLSHLTLSDLNGLELSSTQLKQDKLFEKSEHENVWFNNENQDTVVEKKKGVQTILSQSSNTERSCSNSDDYLQDQSTRLTNNGIGALEIRNLKNISYFKNKSTQTIEQDIRKILQEIKQHLETIY